MSKTSSETLGEKVNLATAIEGALEDGVVSSDEARDLLVRFEEAVKNIHSEARKEWEDLLLQKRKEFQDRIGARADGFIGLKTLDALRKVAGEDGKYIEKRVENIGAVV